MTSSPEIFDVAFGGRRVNFLLHDPEDHIHSHLYYQRTFYEEDLLTAIFRRYMPGMTLIDVGANIGNHSLFAAGVLGARVYAFEPEPTNFSRLTANIAANACGAHITAEQAALGVTPGRCTPVLDKPNNWGMAKVIVDPQGVVPLRPLDSYRFEGPVGFIKIDVEGFELDVLKGAVTTLQSHAPIVFLEAQDHDAFAQTAAFMATMSYTATRRYCVTPTYMFEKVR